MESQPQNPEFRINPENFHPCGFDSGEHTAIWSINTKSEENSQNLWESHKSDLKYQTSEQGWC